MNDEINDDYIEELADYCLNHGTVGAGKSFGINSLIKKLPPHEQARLEKLNEQKRSDFIKRLKTDDDFRKRHEEHRRNMEELKWNFGKK